MVTKDDSTHIVQKLKQLLKPKCRVAVLKIKYPY